MVTPQEMLADFSEWLDSDNAALCRQPYADASEHIQILMLAWLAGARYGAEQTAASALIVANVRERLANAAALN